MAATQEAVAKRVPQAQAAIRSRRLRYCVDNEWRESRTGKYMPVMNPSTGEQIAEAPCCTQDEVDAAVGRGRARLPGLVATRPIPERIQLMFRFKQLLDKHLDELTDCCSPPRIGKVLAEARGDVLKTIEVVECACSTHYLMQGDTCMNVSPGYDTVSYREPLGVFAGIAPVQLPGHDPLRLDDAVRASPPATPSCSRPRRWCRRRPCACSNC